LLDAASVLAVEALDIQPGQRVVDLCAAPGGKSLLCALKLDGHGQLIANNRSITRQQHIMRIMDDYLPATQRPMGDLYCITPHLALVSRMNMVGRSCPILLHGSHFI
jgi:hypothetical protein